MSTDSISNQHSHSDDDVLLLMTLRAVVELMGDELTSDQPRPALPDEVVRFIESTDASRLKHLILRSAVALADQVQGSDDDAHNCGDANSME